jgi:hypothetical protein
VRADGPARFRSASKLGPWSYEPVDTKLPRNAKPEHVIQLTTYSFGNIETLARNFDDI